LVGRREEKIERERLLGVKEKEDGTRIYKKGHPDTISMGGEPRSARRGKQT